MPPSSGLRLEQERTRKLKEEVEQMEKAAMQFVAVSSSAGSVQSVTFSGLGTTSMSTAQPNQKQGHHRTKPTSAKSTQQDFTSKSQNSKASTAIHSSHGPIISARLASSSSSGISKTNGVTVLPPKASVTAVKPNPIKSPLPAITSRPSSGSNSDSHTASQTKLATNRGQKRIESVTPGMSRSGKSSKSNSQMSSRRGSVDSSEETNADSAPRALNTQSSQPSFGGRVLRLASRHENASISATNYLMRDGTSFTLGKDIFLKDDIPISMVCDIAIGNDTHLDEEVLDTPPVEATASTDLPVKQVQERRHVHFNTVSEGAVATEPHHSSTTSSGSSNSCAAANDMDNPTSYFVQIEKTLVLKSLVESVKTQETPEERYERLMKLAMQDSVVPITDIDDDIVEQITITPADIMAELASQVN